MLKFRHNVMHISSLKSFENIKGGIRMDCKDVYFVRALGTTTTFAGDIAAMDSRLTGRMDAGNVVYKRFSALPKMISPDEVNFYLECYETWCSSGRTVLRIRTAASEECGKILSEAFRQTLQLFSVGKAGVSSSIEKNFAVKMMAWLDSLCGDVMTNWTAAASVKIVADNIVKRQEYLFFYMLTMLGCDVLLLQSRSDIGASEASLGVSDTFVLGGFSDAVIPPFEPGKLRKPQELPAGAAATVITEAPRKPVNAVHPAREARRKAASNPSAAVQGICKPESASHCPRAEKSPEELAKLASSVVMIAVCDAAGNVTGTGSGIMIGRDGYILTNNHVARGGRFYSVRIEDDETLYNTDEIIKYNSVLDLAVIRIQRKLHPIPVYRGTEKLVRGQKVVAIGSPLGLFNSVSDGIISGFRTIRDVDMIQFTAPISHGSSGGALLNMYGEVIGISTAGIDEGQNLNLAMGYECINDFIRGFV